MRKISPDTNQDPFYVNEWTDILVSVNMCKKLSLNPLELRWEEKSLGCGYAVQTNYCHAFLIFLFH